MSPAALRKAYTPRPLGPVPAVVLHTRSTMGTQSIEQKSLSRHLILYYNAILLGVVALLAVRHLSIMWGRRRKSQLLKKEILEQAERREDKFGVAQGEWWREKREIEEALVAERRQGRWGRAERWATSGLRGRWYWCGLANPLQVGIVVLVTALNVAFVLVSSRRCCSAQGSPAHALSYSGALSYTSEKRPPQTTTSVSASIVCRRPSELTDHSPQTRRLSAAATCRSPSSLSSSPSPLGTTSSRASPASSTTTFVSPTSSSPFLWLFSALFTPSTQLSRRPSGLVEQELLGCTSTTTSGRLDSS